MSSSEENPTFTSYHIPFSAILQWPLPNYINPERRTWVVPIVFVLYGLATTAVAVRLYARLSKKAGKFALDDMLIIFAWIFGTAFVVTGVYGVYRGGLDRHIWDVQPEVAVRGGFIAWSSEWIFLTGTSFSKISVLLFYRRLITNTYTKKLQMAVNIAITFTVLYWITFMLFAMLVCMPIQATWESLDLSNPIQYKCVDRKVVDLLVAGLSVLSDAYALVIPEIVVSSLQIQKSKKLPLYLIFGCGLIVCAAGIGRAVWFGRMATDPLRDQTWHGYGVILWAQIEYQMAIVCASAPAIKPLFSNARKNLPSNRASSIQMSSGSNKKDSYISTVESTNKSLLSPIVYSPPARTLQSSKSRPIIIHTHRESWR